MASNVTVQNGENGHQHSHYDANHHQHTSWNGKKSSKPRSSPRPVSTGVNGSGNVSSVSSRNHDSSATSTVVVSPPPANPVKPQSWSESNMEPSMANRVRIREKLTIRPVSATVAGKLRQQRERRRTKRRGPYIPSTEGTSTGDEDGELFQIDNVQNSSCAENETRCRNSVHQSVEPAAKAPPPSASSRRFSSPTMRRMSKSPSDLDADDEDNQDYDSASMVSASELTQARVRTLQESAVGDDAVFNAQFQEIRMAGMQQLAEIDAIAGPTSVGDGFVELASSGAEEHVGKILEKERREKSVLIQELGQKELRIYEMEKLVSELNRRLLDSGLENDHLKAENRALLQAMAKLSAGE